jgi:N-methylhydantoinase A
LRYKGQSFELEIKKTSADIAAEFNNAHLKRYGYAQDSNIVEVVSARLRSTGIVEKLAEQRRTSARGSRKKEFAKAVRNVDAYVDGKKRSVAVYRRAELKAGTQLRAPCIVTEYSSTTLIPPGVSAELDSYGNLIIQVT